MARCTPAFALALLALTGPACRPEAPASSTPETRTQGETVSHITFDADFHEPQASPALVAGGKAQITYDAHRLYDIVDGESSVGWFASSFHCYGYGCCEVKFPEIYAGYRFGGGGDQLQPMSDGAAEIALPSDAPQMSLWFSAPGFEIRTWYCGCSGECADENYQNSSPHWVDHSTFDSRYGANYAFDVEPAGLFPVVHGQTVKLLDAAIGNYGCSSCGTFSGEIELRNIDYTKQVRIAYTVIGGGSTMDGAWDEIDATYLGPSANGFERWSFETTGAPFLFGETRFALRYDVAGQTYWDNNCGWDYSLDGYGTHASGHACN